MKIEEPPDKSIVGWGYPVITCHVRIDDYTLEWGDAYPDVRWFVSNSEGDDPVSWATLLERNKRYGQPYLLTPTPLGEGN